MFSCVATLLLEQHLQIKWVEKRPNFHWSKVKTTFRGSNTQFTEDKSKSLLPGRLLVSNRLHPLLFFVVLSGREKKWFFSFFPPGAKKQFGGKKQFSSTIRN